MASHEIIEAIIAQGVIWDAEGHGLSVVQRSVKQCVEIQHLLALRLLWATRISSPGVTIRQ